MTCAHMYICLQWKCERIIDHRKYCQHSCCSGELRSKRMNKPAYRRLIVSSASSNMHSTKKSQPEAAVRRPNQQDLCVGLSVHSLVFDLLNFNPCKELESPPGTFSQFTIHLRDRFWGWIYRMAVLHEADPLRQLLTCDFRKIYTMSRREKRK